MKGREEKGKALGMEVKWRGGTKGKGSEDNG